MQESSGFAHRLPTPQEDYRRQCEKPSLRWSTGGTGDRPDRQRWRGIPGSLSRHTGVVKTNSTWQRPAGSIAIMSRRLAVVRLANDDNYWRYQKAVNGARRQRGRKRYLR